MSWRWMCRWVGVVCGCVVWFRDILYLLTICHLSAYVWSYAGVDVLVPASSSLFSSSLIFLASFRSFLVSLTVVRTDTNDYGAVPTPRPTLIRLSISSRLSLLYLSFIYLT